jgi:TRAP-type C4-dicarboxylate transport system permease small subunit
MIASFRRLADRMTEAAAVVVLIALLGSVVMGVVSRALNNPVVWSDELARFLMVWLALLGWILALRRRSHIRITVLLGLMPSGVRRAVEIAIQAAVLVFGALLLRDSFVLVERNLDIEAVSMPIPSAVIYVPVVFAGLATALQALGEIAELATRRNMPAVTGGEII